MDALKKGMVMIAVPFIFQFGIFVQYSHMLDQAEVLQFHEYHSKWMTARLNWLTVLLAAASLSGIEYALTDDKEYLWMHGQALALAKPEPSELEKLVESNTRQGAIQKASVDKMVKLSKQLADMVAPIPKVYEQEGRDKALALFTSKDFKEMWRKIIIARGDVLDSEHKLYRATTDALPDSRKQMKMIVNIGMAFDVFVAFLLMSVFSSTITKRLDVLTDNSNRLAKGQPLSPPVSGHDEITTLDQSFRSMADALDRARKRSRRLSPTCSLA